MAVVREDVVKLGFEFDSKGMDKANDAVDGLLDNTQELGGKNGTGKAEDGFDDAAKAAKKFGETSLDKLSDGIDKVVAGVGRFVLSAGKAAFTGLATAAATGTAALVALGTQAINSYAEYEQLKGGVETLFGAGGQTMKEYADSLGKPVTAIADEYKVLMKSQDMVLRNANDAYKTAGMSANQYMDTVTSFSASLKQSLGGDTVKAAEIADQAIVDMADNANKMGTDISMIQNAYQGFAKQNYTMLDNLKLGYGGTQEEMKRLLKDAEKLTGKKYDISNFADVAEAIHVIQEEMGIAGTTAKEASETIQGSALAMKAAWTNFIGGMANEDADFDQLLNNLVDSVKTFLGNIIPRIKKMLPRLVRGLTEIVKVIGKELPGILEDLLPSLIQGGMSLIKSLGGALMDNVGTFKNIGLSIAKMIYKGITGKEMPDDMFASLKNKLDEVCGAVGDIVAGVVDFGKKLWVAVGPALLFIADLAIDAFVWIGDNINWLLPILGSLLGAMLAFKAVKSVTGIVKGFMGLFSLGGKGGAGAAAGGAAGGAGGGGFLGGFASMKPGTILKAMGNIAIIVGGMAILAGLLAWAAPYFAELTDAGSFGKLMAAIVVVGLVGTGLTHLAGAVGNIPVATVSKGLANIAIIMVGLGALAFVIGWASELFTFDVGEMTKLMLTIGVVGLIGSALAGLAGLIGMIPVAVVLTGLENIALVLGGMTAVISAFAALSLIDGFNDFIAKGGETLTQICNIIGEMAGSIVGGFAEGVTNSLPAIGQNLADFATSIQPMFNTFAGVDAAGLKDFATALAALIAVIAGEKLVSVITGGINYGELGTNLNTLANSLSGFFGTIMTFPEGSFEKATALFNCLAGISAMPKEGGIVGWFEGEVDYAKMATGLNWLATTVPAFNALMNIPDEAFAKAKGLFDCLAGISALPNEGGLVGWFQGEVNFASIANGVQTLASPEMVTALKTIAGIPAEGFTALTNMFDALAGIKQMPEEGGIASWFTGDASTALTSVAAALPGVATNIASFFTNLGGRTDFTPIKSLFETLGNIDIDADAASKGFLGLGTSDFEALGTGLSNFATNASTFFTTIKDVSPTEMQTFFDVLGTAGELPTKLEGVNGELGTVLDTMNTTVQTKMETVKGTIESGLLAAISAIISTAQNFYSAGQSLMIGLNNGIMSKKGQLIATAQGIADSIRRTIESALDINSPSKVGVEIGQYFDMGINQGMQSMIPDIQVTAREVGNATIPYSGNYTPENSTSYYSSGGDSEYTSIAPVFNLTVSGTTDDRATARRIKRYVAEAIQETFDSLERKSYAVREV